MDDGCFTETKQLVCYGEIAIQIALRISLPHDRGGSYTMLDEGLFQTVDGITSQCENCCEKFVLMNNARIEVKTKPFHMIMIDK